MNHEDLEGEFLQYASIVKLTEGQEMTGIETAALVASIKNGLDLFKNIADAKDEAKCTELIRVISKMNGELAKLENELADRLRESTAKDNEIAEFKEQVKQLKEKPQSLTLKGKFYYKQNDERPFCPVCYDSTDLKISLLTEATEMEQSAFGYQYKCVTCKTKHTA